MNGAVEPATGYVTVLDSPGVLVYENRRVYNMQSVKTPVIIDFRLPGPVAGPRLPLFIHTPRQNVTFARRFVECADP